MPRVLEDTDILEYPSSSPADDTFHVLPPGMRTSPRECSCFLTFLSRLLTPVSRLRPRRQECGVPGTPRFETPLDMLAREHFDIYLLVMGGIG
ncbi:MAG TPA: hypothetical protein VIH59_09790 [Candidatus Tectomicrobia bacterium]|jgi:hypothetical protein